MSSNLCSALLSDGGRKAKQVAQEVGKPKEEQGGDVMEKQMVVCTNDWMWLMNGRNVQRTQLQT